MDDQAPMSERSCAGAWKSKREKNHLVVMVEPFDQLTPDVWRGWEAETEDLAHYLGVKAMLRVTTPSG